MRKIIGIIICVLLSINLLSAQDFNKWSIEPEFGLTKIRDITPVEFYNTGIGGRYMFTQFFGVKVSGHYTQVPYGANELEYVSGKIMGVANFGRLAKLERVWNNRWTIIGGIGGDYTDSRGFTNEIILHRISDFHLAAFVDNEFRVTDKIFISTILNVKTGVNSRRNMTEANRTMTTSIIDFNIGVVFALGNKKDHADFYLEPDKPTLVYVYQDNTKYDSVKIINIYKNTYNIENDQSPEFVYFNNDSYVIDKDGLDNIEKSSYKVKDSIVITAYCSNVASPEYNLILATNRGNAVKDKLVKLGVSADKITVISVGIDPSREYDMARRVKIEFK